MRFFGRSAAVRFNESQITNCKVRIHGMELNRLLTQECYLHFKSQRAKGAQRAE